MEIKACPRCGGTRIFARAGIQIDYCSDCSYYGSAIIFNSEKDYRQFLKGLKNKTK